MMKGQDYATVLQRWRIPTRRWLLLSCVLIGIVAFSGRPGAQGPAAFHGIGDLTGGGVGSAVRDATRVNGTIYAVGSSTVVATATLSAVPNLDTPALWTWPGSGGGTLEALPNTTAFVSTQTSPISAYAITANGAYFASQARPNNTTSGTNWVRVDKSLLPGITANLNLSNAPGTPAFAALAISESGGVIYGQTQTFPGGVDTRVATRYEPGLGFNFPDLTPTGKTWGFPIPRGTSADGLVMVGAAANGQIVGVPILPSGLPLATNAVAFRYVHNAGTLTGTTTVIPTLPGGTWNMPVALSTTGDRTVVIGNSTDYPTGEVYLTNAANAITATLGSPNTGLMPRALGGMTADGTVVAVTFASSIFGLNQINGLGLPPAGKYAYIHNSHGWFHLASVLAAQDVDLVAMGWDPTNVAVTGIRTVEGVDLVFGQGRRRTVGAAGYVDGALEGFVAELPAGVLAAFNPTPTPPADESIVGAWAAGDPSNPTAVITYLADGSFVRIDSTGFERGLYGWAGNATGGAFTMTTLYDTNGSGGLSGLNGRSGLAITVVGDTHTRTDSYCLTCSLTTFTRITGGPGSIVGGWVGGNPAEPDNTFVLVFLDGSAGYKYFAAFDQPAGADDYAEIGTYSWDPITHELIATPKGGGIDAGNFVTLTRDELGLHVIDDGGETFDLTRIVAPSTVLPVITNATLEAGGGEDAAFSYTVTATNALTFGATGLPSGVTIDPATGVISGTPTVNGTFNVTITVTNTFGDTDVATLVLTFAAPPVPSATGVGDVTFSTSAGLFASLVPIAEATLPTVGKPGSVTFPFGFFSWTVTNLPLPLGQTITVTMTYPAPVAAGAVYWKVINGIWVDATSVLGSNDGDNVLTLTIADGGFGDADGLVNGQISDPGGVGFPSAPTPPSAGRIGGAGHIDANGKRHHFEFRASERTNGADRGSLRYNVTARPRDGDRPGRFVSTDVTDVVFSDDPAFRPGRRPLPTVDTVDFAGTGQWNGVAGYSFRARAADVGEPGLGRDTFTLTISDPSGATVASVSGVLAGGNIQSSRVVKR